MENQKSIFDLLQNIDGVTIANPQSGNSKSPKQKLLRSIESEISILNGREDLQLLNLTYTNRKTLKTYTKRENRFWNKPQNGKVSFYLKHKGVKVEIEGMENKSFSCEDNPKTLSNVLREIHKTISSLNEDNEMFNQKVFNKTT